MADGMERKGGCMCGAVTFTATNVPGTYGICHCEMCRRWTGSSLLGVTVPTDCVTWQNEAQIGTLQSSPWAERAWCKRCGSNLYFRVTEPGKWFGKTEIPLGLFDDPGGFALTNEIYIDHKPDSFAFVGEGHEKLTRDDCVARFTDASAAPSSES
jgi:hypothetical protein